MKEYFRFKEEGHLITNEYVFYDDYIERKWRTLTRKGEINFYRSEIGEKVSSQTTFGYGNKSILKTGGLYFILGLFFHMALNIVFLDYIGFVFYGLAFACLVGLVVRMKKEEWLYFHRKNGKTLFCVRVNGLQGTTKEELIDQFRKYSSVQPVAGGDATR